MTNTKMLVGSLSNDLLRAAVLEQRGAHTAARRFLEEAKRWAEPLQKQTTQSYIKKIAQDVVKTKADKFTMEKAEQYLMYSILLQNHALHSI